MQDSHARLAPGTEAPDSAEAQARTAAAGHLAAAVAAVENELGPGQAAANPALVASLVQAAAIHTAIGVAREIHTQTLETVARVSRDTNETILRLKPRLF